MKTVCKKLLSLMLVAMLLVSAVPFQVFATEGDVADPIETTAAAAETTAATEAPAPEATVTAQNTANTPAVQFIGDIVTVRYVVEYEDGQYATIKEYTNQKAGAKFPSAPSSSDVLKVYAQWTGSSAGKKFLQWELDGEYFSPSGKYIPGINEGDAEIEVVAILTNAEQKITLNANSGSVSPSYIMAVVGSTYPELPTPTRTHYNFAGWWVTRNNVEIEVKEGDPVYDTNTLKAHWEKKDYTVNYQHYVLGEGWVDSGYGASVPANSTVSAAAGTFPTDAQIKADFALTDYTIVGWEIGETDTAFKAGSTKITSDIVVRPRYQRTVTLQARNPDTYINWDSKTMTVEIGEPIGKMSNPQDRNGYVFTGWTSEDLAIMISTKANLSNTSAHPNYDPELHGDIFYAAYTKSTTVYLYIHINGNTKDHDAVVRYYVPSEGEFDMRTINMYSIYSKYGNYDDSDDTVSAWYSLDEWKNYSAGLDNSPAQVYTNIGENGPYEYHIMLTNGGSASSNSSSSGTSSGNSYNNNSSTADSTNPTTGDQIFMAVTVLAVSATALALVFFLKKRKAC